MKIIRKLFLLVAIMTCFVFYVQAADVAESGHCGDSVSYTLYDDGLLEIQGTGIVSDSFFRDRTDIVKVKFLNGVTEIGDYAFYGLKSIEEVDFPDSLKIIGEGAFFGCENLKEIIIPDSVTSYNGNKPLGTACLGAFDGCTNLQHIQLSSNAERLPWGFLGSDQLRKLIIPEGVTQLDAYAVLTCERLCYVEIPSTVTKIVPWAFLNNFSLTNIVFKGNAPEMGDLMGPCGAKNYVGFYPKDDPSWADVETLTWQAGLDALIPYTLDAEGNIIPESPKESDVLEKYQMFVNQNYPAGANYPNHYYYIINGNFIDAYGSEAFAFQLSDAMFGYLPISDIRAVIFENLKLGDILYLDGRACVITDIDSNTATVAGVGSDEKVYYNKVLTKAQVNQGEGYRTRYGVSPGAGVWDPSVNNEKITVPDGTPTEEQVYQRIMALKETHPEGMPYNLKNHYYLNVEVTWMQEFEQDGEIVLQPLSIERYGAGCSAFGYLASDTAFGMMPARYTLAKDMDYDDIMVGDNLLGYGHEVVVLEVYQNCVVVCEGNYNGTMHWGRILTREEVEGNYDILTRYPEGTVAPERTNHLPELSGGVASELDKIDVPNATPDEIRDSVQAIDTEALKSAMLADQDNSGVMADIAKLEEAVGGPAEVDVSPEVAAFDKDKVSIVGANLNNAESESDPVTLVLDKPKKEHVLDTLYRSAVAVSFSMDLENVKDTENLEVPVKITLPVPSAINPQFLVILHYYANGNMEEVNPYIYAEGGQFYAEFVLTSFSDFIMTEYAQEDECTHSWADATCTAPKTCKLCGVTEGEKLPHIFDQEKVDPKYLASEGTYYKSCKCGVKGTETFTVSEQKPNEFKDVPANAYYHDAVMWAVQNKVTSGTGDGTTFEPNAICTRGQVVTFLWRAAGEPEPKNTVNPFVDVKSSDYFYKAVLWAKENNITSGTGDGSTFEPHANCNRAQIVTFLSRAKNGQPTKNDNPFTDVATNAYYYKPVLWAVENGITTGTGDGTTFEPNNPCTRGQVITFLWRAYTK